MDVSRSVIEVLVGKKNAVSTILDLAIFSPVEHSTWARFIWCNPGDNHTLPHMISLGYMNLHSESAPKKPWHNFNSPKRTFSPPSSTNQVLFWRIWCEFFTSAWIAISSKVNVSIPRKLSFGRKKRKKGTKNKRIIKKYKKRAGLYTPVGEHWSPGALETHHCLMAYLEPDHRF